MKEHVGSIMIIYILVGGLLLGFLHTGWWFLGVSALVINLISLLYYSKILIKNLFPCFWDALSKRNQL